MIKQNLILLVFLLIFATVASETVHGEDTVYVHNVVESSSHSGGYSSNGADGTDGKDGEDGQDGTSGQDGRSISVGGDTATVELHTVTTKDEFQATLYASTTGTGEVHERVTAIKVEDGATTTYSEDPAPVTTTTIEQRSQLHIIITALQKLIEHYVNVLF